MDYFREIWRIWTRKDFLTFWKVRVMVSAPAVRKQSTIGD